MTNHMQILSVNILNSKYKVIFSICLYILIYFFYYNNNIAYNMHANTQNEPDWKLLFQNSQQQLANLNQQMNTILTEKILENIQHNEALLQKNCKIADLQNTITTAQQAYVNLQNDYRTLLEQHEILKKQYVQSSLNNTFLTKDNERLRKTLQDLTTFKDPWENESSFCWR